VTFFLDQDVPTAMQKLLTAAGERGLANNINFA